MNETQLQIIVTAVNNASAALEEVSGQLSGMATTATETGATISNALTPAEEAIADQAQAIVDNWDVTMNGAVTGTQEAVTGIEEAFQGIPASVQAVESGLIESWDSSLGDLASSMATPMAEVEGAMVAGATAAGDAAGTAAGEGFGGYFKKMIIGYALEQIGSFLSGGINSAIASVSQSQDKISSLTAQIDQQRASIATNEADLNKWVGTTQEISAAHEAAAANIQAETAKITALQQQLAPLETTQQGLIGQITNIADNILIWIGAHKQLDAAIQSFMTTLGPMMEAIGIGVIAITLFGIALQILSTPMLILIALAVTVAVLTALWTAFHSQIMDFLSDLNSNFGVIDFFEGAWESIASNFKSELLPALEQLFAALTPLWPILKDIAEVIGVVLLMAIETTVGSLTTLINLFTGLLTLITDLTTIMVGAFKDAINGIATAISSLVSNPAFKTVAGLIGGVASGIGSVAGAVGSAIPAFANGGIVSTPTLALVGEAGPEAIIPLSSFQGGGSLSANGGAAGAINITIAGGMYLNQGGASQIAEALATMIGRQLKVKNFV